jgi:small nuclear ribonucleoprotein (snRNP)-like protein
MPCSIRGQLVGYIRAFDKHFNLLLTDVDEIYTIENKSTNLVSNDGIETMDVSM